MRQAEASQALYPKSSASCGRTVIGANQPSQVRVEIRQARNSVITAARFTMEIDTSRARPLTFICFGSAILRFDIVRT
jgi:hypothetical protein